MQRRTHDSGVAALSSLPNRIDKAQRISNAGSAMLRISKRASGLGPLPHLSFGRFFDCQPYRQLSKKFLAFDSSARLRVDTISLSDDPRANHLAGQAVTPI
jgi:hypothetical protein